MRILVIGEINPDLILQGYSHFPVPGREVLVDDTTLTLGSASAICAAGLARLGNNVAMLGKVGRDPWGDFCIDRLRALGVDTRFVIRDPAVKTGITVSISSPSDRALVTYLGAMERFSHQDIDSTVFGGFRHVHISSFYMQRALRPHCRELFEAAHRAGLTTSLDPGYDPSEQWAGGLGDTLSATDVFFPNKIEIEGITGVADPVVGLRKLANGRTLTVAKLGARGSVALDVGIPLHVPAMLVDPVDTTGAGDSFDAGFLHYWVQHKPLAEAMRFAAACGALSTLGLGGTGAQATEAAALEFLTKGVLT